MSDTDVMEQRFLPLTFTDLGAVTRCSLSSEDRLMETCGFNLCITKKQIPGIWTEPACFKVLRQSSKLHGALSPPEDSGSGLSWRKSGGEPCPEGPEELLLHLRVSDEPVQSLHHCCHGNTRHRWQTPVVREASGWRRRFFWSRGTSGSEELKIKSEHGKELSVELKEVR